MRAHQLTTSPSSVRGRVVQVFFSSPQFSAGRLRTRNGDVVSFAGALMVRQADSVVLHGSWERHPKFGAQLKVSSFQLDLRMDVDGLAHYLANHPRMPGIGIVRARRVAESFGEDFDRAIDEEPERVAEVAKVPLDSVHALRAEWLRTRTVNAAMTWLASYELTHHQVSTLVAKLGDSVITALKTDPYMLVREIPGFGFKRVDVIARRLGTAKGDPARIRAGIAHCVVERLDQGDCWVDYEDLVELTNTVLVMDVCDSREQIERELDATIAEGNLACVSLGGRFLIAQPRIHRMEIDLAEVFTNELGVNPHFAGLDVDEMAAAIGAGLNEKQRRLLEVAARHSLVLLSGPAGSGKTRCVAAITQLYEARGLKVVLAAPTGKAAKRMEQVTGREAFTLHRLLGFNGRTFAAGPDAPIDASVVIVDEVSMMDVPLAWQFFRAVDPKRTAVVLVGDHNQLPPVGPGNLLRDLIERLPIPTVILGQVMRQAGILKENSMAILAGEVRRTVPGGPGGKPAWVVVNRLTDVLDVQRYVFDLFESVLADRLGLDLLADVQLITPTRKGPLGVEALNVELQRLLQRKLWDVDVPEVGAGRRPELLLHDRVIQTRNNYELGVMNGAIGVVTGVGRTRGELTVRFDDNEVECTPENEGAKDLSLAYALTVHRMQGGQVPCAVVLIHKAHSFMHHRNLFYTAVTRAQTLAIIVGDQWGMKNCVTKEQVERRKTFLSVLELPRAEEWTSGVR